MAVIGQSITQPEATWKRYDDLDVNITYVGNVITQATASSYEGATTQLVGNQDEGTVFYRFNFTGSKLRLYSRLNTTYSGDLTVFIDGKNVGKINQTGVNTYQALTFNIENLDNSEHYVEVINNTRITCNLDAIDIDENGELKKFNSNLYQNKTLIKSGTKYFSSIYENKTNKVPAMVANTNPSGEVTASSANSSTNEWRIFDRVNTTYWQTNNGMTTDQWIMYKFENPMVISNYSIIVSNFAISPNTFKLQGSNNGIDFDDLMSVENKTDWINNTVYEFESNNKKEYLYYRLFVVNNNGGSSIRVNELEFISPIVGKLTEIDVYNESNILKYGTDSNKEMNLTAPINTIQYVVSKSNQMGNGKVFSRIIDTEKFKIKNLTIL